MENDGETIDLTFGLDWLVNVALRKMNSDEPQTTFRIGDKTPTWIEVLTHLRQLRANGFSRLSATGKPSR